MVNLVDLQSALRLLSSSPPDKTGKSDQSLDQLVSDETKPPISGAGSQTFTPAFFTVGIAETLSIKNGQVEGTFQSTTSSQGSANTAAAASFVSIYKNMFDDTMSENALTSQQLTTDAENNVTLGSATEDEQTFRSDLNEYLGGTSQAGQIEEALENHTLQIQNVADVQGLDWTVAGSSRIGANGAGSSGGPLSFNSDFLAADADGKQHALMGYGSIEVYLTW